MKKLIFIIVVLISVKPLYAQTDALDQDQRAIKNIIAAETAAYIERDSALLISFYTNDAITQNAWNTPDGSYGQFKGLQQMKKSFGDAFRANPVAPYQPEIERLEWFFRPLGKEWMWVNFSQKITTTQGKIYNTYETRMMKLESSGWKMAVVYSLSNHGK
jgi:hypothetical protein